MASAINGESIYNAAASCSHLFEQYVQTFGPTTGKLDLAEDLQGQFNLWAAYIGAITTTKSSLDARLVGQDGLKSMILELLIMIRDNLKHELDTKLDSVATLAESIDGIPESLPLLLGLRAVHVAVRRLHALGRLIQRSMAKECQERQFFDSQHQDDSRCFKDFVKIKFPNATQGLISQLSQSICIRKRSIFYQQQNGMNSVIGREYSLSRPQSKEHITRASENVEMEVPANHHTTSTSEDIFISEAAGFHINVQELHSSLEKSKATHFHSNENPSIREIQNEEFSYPNMPIAAKDELNAMCPICSKSLEVVSLTRRMWNVHIDQDIEPYVCISEECKQPPRFFAHIQDWETHMHIKHGVDWARNIHAITWCCEMDHSEENVDKKIFDDKSDFIHHLSTAHGKNLTKPQILAKSRRSRKFQPRGAFTCPLCNCCPKEIASRLAEEPYSLLSEHISRHLKALAFASLFDLTYEHQKPSSSRGRQITGGQDRADGPTTTHLTSEEPFANIQPTIVEEPRRPSDDQMLPESPEPESPVISPRVHSKPLEISERFAVVSSNNTVSQQEQSPEKIYEQMMETIGSRGPTTKRLAWRLISWLTCSMRPMTVLELQHALAVQAGDNSLLKNNIPKIEDMVSACGGYLTITTDMNTLQFTNEALGKWLEKTWYARFPNAHDYITDICVTYLGFDTFETGFSDSDNAFEKRLRSYALYHYAAQKWGWHARVSSTKENPSIVSFLMNENKVSASSQAMLASGNFYAYSQKPPRHVTGLHLAAYFGLEGISAILLQNSINVEVTDSNERTPLSWAAETGQTAVGRLLLENGADVNSRDSGSYTPLLIAAWHGHNATVRLLLERHAHIESREPDDYTPLLLAAFNGHEPTVRLLLESGANIEAREGNHYTPLLLAAFNGNEPTVRLLLERGANIETREGNQYTPLSLAAFNGHEPTVRLLLEWRANIEAREPDGYTPLLLAAFNGHKTIVRLLLKRHTDVKTRETNDYTPLSSAPFHEQKPTLRSLLKWGADLKARELEGYRPLALAASEERNMERRVTPVRPASRGLTKRLYKKWKF